MCIRDSPPPPPPPATGGQDRISNCASLKSKYGCDACCLPDGKDVANSCPKTCSSSGSGLTDQASNCAALKSQYGCDACCLGNGGDVRSCLLYTSPSPRDRTRSRMPSSA
eukprot:TRINITY_DN1072_c0_g1_i7.p2 TRINITY_DN1072_c0_g1~~TRINITY_DN1072_c0_g1_i7.p2  ORF type:complete len:110 (+),score=29.36 TRINITY_DN1072_c0_g1_i7:128-457(+)